jgi:hypothetical protein
VKRHGAFPYNADQKGPLVREQKTQNQVSRRLLGLWVWGHDPWRWARKHDIVRMPPCPDVPWIGMTEKRKYGKVEVKMNPTSRTEEYTLLNPPKRVKPTELAKKAVKSIQKKNLLGRGSFGSVFNIPGTGFVFKVERLVDPDYYAALISWLRGKGEKPTFPAEQRRVFKYDWPFDPIDLAFPVYAVGNGESPRYHTIMHRLGGKEVRVHFGLKDQGIQYVIPHPEKRTAAVLDYLKTVSKFPQSSFNRLVRNFAQARGLGLNTDYNPANAMVDLEKKRFHVIDWWWEYGPKDKYPSFDPYYAELFSAAIELKQIQRQLLMPKWRKEIIKRTSWSGYEKATREYDECVKLCLKVMGKFVRAFEKEDVEVDGSTAFPVRDVGRLEGRPIEVVILDHLYVDNWPTKKERQPFWVKEAAYPPVFDWGVQEVKANPRTPEGKKFPQRYLTGLTPLERMIAEDEIDKGYEYDVNDPEAYEFWKSDIKATARGLKIGPSKHKEEYYRRYRKNIDKDYKPSGDSPKARFINRIAKETGIKRSLIEKVYDKGLAAWRVGHRPGVQQHQWAAGRVYAFAVGADSSTGPGKPDNKIAVEAGVR